MRKKVTIIAIILMSLLGTGFASAQNQNKKKDWEDKIKAEKIAYLTDAMDLSPAEAERFWPLYNKAEAETRQCWRLMMEAYRALEASIDAGKDDKEIGVLLDKFLDAQEASRGIERKYTTEYRKILSNDKIARLYISEENFRRQQIHKLNKNDNNKTDKK
ncbi:MAG: hypothetical protein J6N54_08595 [Bacteroidales bacterium]|nr:hypothetical protein [Bacteroidales bacterium]